MRGAAAATTRGSILQPQGCSSSSISSSGSIVDSWASTPSHALQRRSAGRTLRKPSKQNIIWLLKRMSFFGEAPLQMHRARAAK